MSFDILLLGLDPEGRDNAALESEIGAFVQVLERPRADPLAVPRVTPWLVADLGALEGALDDVEPAIVHWLGRRLFTAAELGRGFASSSVDCVLLPSFDPERFDALLEHVACVISVPPGAEGRDFVMAFYGALADGHGYLEAFERGRAALVGRELPFDDLPRLASQDLEIAERAPRRSRRGLGERPHVTRGSRASEPETEVAWPAPGDGSFSVVPSPAEVEETPWYPLWFGTDRKPRDPADLSRGFGHERGELLYGTCRVAVPKSHKIGETGSSWWKRLWRGSDDRLRLDAASLELFDHDDFWRRVAAALAEPAAVHAGGKTAVVFIHGYNVSFEEAALRGAQIGFDLQIPSMAFYSWPSRGNLLGYAADEATIEASEKHIARFLLEFVRESGAEAVHVIAHSMGNRGLLRALQRILGEVTEAADVPFGQIILAAPDVDQDVFRDLASAYRRLSRRTTLYVSSRDRAVSLSGLLRDAPRVGFTPPVTVVPGVDTVEVTQVDLSFLGHGYFAAARDLLHDIHSLLLDDAPPERRLGLRRRETETGPYWVIAG